ncbi:MAG: SDR family NAD(P)-dependent oxidoreductase, partial [Actinobacteria bacterium]|nr:SDR family NAD(P)-dependent oxidoreductase [Actinomycetota bacterium]
MKNNFFDLKGKTSIVTGGGRGIGRSIAIALAKSGSDVAVADIDLNNSSNVSKEIIKLGTRSIGLKIDVTKKEDTEKL